MIAEKKYIDECGGFCPGCGKVDSIRKLPSSTQFLRGEVKVFYACTSCHVDWWEVYRLVSLEAC